MNILKDIVETRLRNLIALMDANEELKSDVYQKFVDKRNINLGTKNPFEIELEYGSGLLKSILDEYADINAKTNHLINKLK
jgi:hypothetical protein